MNTFAELYEEIKILEEGTRDKAKGFKKQIRPIIKQVRDAQIGDPRRYAYMLVWPFLRDVLKVPEIQDQDTPKNAALIQRKLEEISDRGDLPDDAGAQFIEYANEHFDDFVNQISATKRNTSLKSHYRGQDVKKHVDVAGGGTGFTDGETAAERRARVAAEREILDKIKKYEKEKGGLPEDGFEKLGVDQQDVADEYRKAFEDIADTLVPGETYIIEIAYNKEQYGPLVQRSVIERLFPPEDIVDEPYWDTKSGIFEVEVSADSSIAKAIKEKGVETVEQFIKKYIKQKLDRDVGVSIMEPESKEGFDDKYRSLFPKDNKQNLDVGVKGYFDDYGASDPQQASEDSESTAETTIILPNGRATVSFVDGQIVDIQSDNGLKFDIQAANSEFQQTQDIEAALMNNIIGGVESDTITESTSAYIPKNWMTETRKKVEYKSTREMWKPTTNHQMAEYRRLYRV